MEDKVLNQALARKPAIATAVAVVVIALVVALMAALLVTSPAGAASGGSGLGTTNGGGGNTNGNSSSKKCKKANLGKRTLRKGSCGADVVTLHWFLKARKLAAGSGKLFASRTEKSVVKFQKSQNLSPTGVVNKSTVKAAKKRMKSGAASYYGPGFWGNYTACGTKLKKSTIGVAVPAEKIKKYPCGTKILLNYKGRWVRAQVIDTGGFGGHGRAWDLTEKTAKLLNKNYASHGVFNVRSAVQSK